MSFFEAIVANIVVQIGDKIADRVQLSLEKKFRFEAIGNKATELKRELNEAQSSSEREAILDKVHSLINDIDGL